MGAVWRQEDIILVTEIARFAAGGRVWRQHGVETAERRRSVGPVEATSSPDVNPSQIVFAVGNRAANGGGIDDARNVVGQGQGDLDIARGGKARLSAVAGGCVGKDLAHGDRVAGAVGNFRHASPRKSSKESTVVQAGIDVGDLVSHAEHVAMVLA